MELKLDAAAEGARDIVLAGRCGADLESHRGRVLVKILQAQDARAVHNRLRPGCIAAQLGGCGFQRLQSFFLGELGREGNVHEGLRPVAAEVRHDSDVAVRKRHECPARVCCSRAFAARASEAAGLIKRLVIRRSSRLTTSATMSMATRRKKTATLAS